MGSTSGVSGSQMSGRENLSIRSVQLGSLGSPGLGLGLGFQVRVQVRVQARVRFRVWAWVWVRVRVRVGVRVWVSPTDEYGAAQRAKCFGRALKRAPRRREDDQLGPRLDGVHLLDDGAQRGLALLGARGRREQLVPHEVVLDLQGDRGRWREI